MKALRLRVGLSQTALAARTEELDQSYICKLENKRNKAGSFRVRAALARGFGVPLEEFAGYLDGRISIEQLLAHRLATH